MSTPKIKSKAIENPGYWDNPDRERHMQHEHEPAWRAMIDLVEEDLSNRTVLDFGCNQGGFLRLLHEIKPYRRALGIDIAEQSIAEANSRKGSLPCDYKTNQALVAMTEYFDVVFSHEVVYLLPDLTAHAKEIHNLLKPGGVYYIAIGAYTDNPLWQRWRGIVSTFSPVRPQDYSLQDIALAFQKNGFTVAVQKLACAGFFSYDATDDRYLKSPEELVDFMTNRMMLFRMKKDGAQQRQNC